MRRRSRACLSCPGGLCGSFVKWVILSSAAAVCSAAIAAPYTPKPGSPERVAICDSVREYFVREHSHAKPKMKIVFKIEYLKVDGKFAFFQGAPIYEDGSDAVYDCLMDMGYSLLLQKKSEVWTILADFCGTDIPHEEWWQDVRHKLPREVPADILPRLYREHLGL